MFFLKFLKNQQIYKTAFKIFKKKQKNKQIQQFIIQKIDGGINEEAKEKVIKIGQDESIHVLPVSTYYELISDPGLIKEKQLRQLKLYPINQPKISNSSKTQTNATSVSKNQIQQRRKNGMTFDDMYSGFCNMEICDLHLRKRRRLNKKFERICDYCQDKHLFDNYMKLEIKAQEALTTQEEIVNMKYNQYLSQVEKRRQKRNDIIFKTQSIKSDHQQKLQSLHLQQTQLSTEQKAFEKQQIQLKQLQLIVQRMDSAMKENFQQDYKILLIENQKLSKDLINLDKRKQQIRKAIEKREKEIQTAYEQWEKKEYIKNMQRQSMIEAKQKKDCVIY